MDRDDYDDYDDYDDGYDDYDGADDWEAEADQLEQEEKAKEAEKQARLEKKLATRAPAKKAEEEEETLLPQDVQNEVERLIQEAAGIDDSLLKGESVQIIADLPVTSDEEATVVGHAIADRLLELSDKSNYDELITTFFKEIASEFKSIPVLNEEINRAHVAAEELKRQQKANGGKKEAAKKSTATADALDFAAVEDKGGAEVADDYESPW